MPHKPILIVDGHLDMAFNALFHRRDLTQPVQVLREREDWLSKRLSQHPDSLERKQGPPALGRGTVTVSLPEMRKGHVGIMVATIMARVQMPWLMMNDGMRTQAAAHAIGQSHLAYYQQLERQGELFWIRDEKDLDTCVALWANPKNDTPIGIILGMESADPILGPDNVEDWWNAGLRSVSLTHHGANTYGHGTGTEGGLYPPAYPLMDALSAAGVALDVTHASEIAFWQILDYWNGPLHASHCNCRALVPGKRHLTDEMIKAIVERDGVIGMVFAELMLNPHWNWDDTNTYQNTAVRTMSAVIEHIDHICQLVGDSDHVALGTDLDGGFGRELAPTDYDTIADLQKFLCIMEQYGYKEEDVKKIAHENLIRFFKDSWRKGNV